MVETKCVVGIYRGNHPKPGSLRWCVGWISQPSTVWFFRNLLVEPHFPTLGPRMVFVDPSGDSFSTEPTYATAALLRRPWHCEGLEGLNRAALFKSWHLRWGAGHSYAVLCPELCPEFFFASAIDTRSPTVSIKKSPPRHHRSFSLDPIPLKH